MWTRSSGCALTLWRAFIEPMTLHALAYNLANFLRTLASPAGRGRSVVADQPAGEGGEDRGQGDRQRPLRDLPDGEVAVPRELFSRILYRIARLRPPGPAPC